MIDEKKLIEKIEKMVIPLSTPDGSESIDIGINGYNECLVDVLETIKDQPKVNEWIPCNERFPEEHELIDDETGYYNKSDNVLCCGKNEYNEIEYWIDYTIDGEWQCSEYLTGDEMYWRPLPDPYEVKENE